MKIELYVINKLNHNTRRYILYILKFPIPRQYIIKELFDYVNISSFFQSKKKISIVLMKIK